MAKSSARVKKEEIVKKLADKLGSAKSVVLADYQGLNVGAFQEVKNQLEKDEAEFTVAKNTLIDLASKQAGLNIPSEALKGPTALMLAYGDQITPIKDMMRLAKVHGDKPKPKIGFLGTELISVEKIKQLALIPSKTELQANLVGALASPIQGIVGVLGGNLRNLVYALDQIQKSKGGAS